MWLLTNGREEVQGRAGRVHGRGDTGSKSQVHLVSVSLVLAVQPWRIIEQLAGGGEQLAVQLGEVAVFGSFTGSADVLPAGLREKLVHQAPKQHIEREVPLAPAPHG